MQFERPSGRIRPVDWKGPAPPPPTPVATRHPVVAALSSAATYILTSFALCAAGMYPEISWPVLAELNLRSSRKESPPGGSAADSSQNADEHASIKQPECYACNPNPLSLKSSCNTLPAISRSSQTRRTTS
jgi:hypothetical protein